jgi:class III poly(R)-hydroxyalkanoic acid synthase PhaE subunit
MEKEAPSWAGMTNQLFDTWTDVGTQMWKNWTDLMGAATRNPVSSGKPNLDAVSQQFLENQQLLTRLLQLSFTSWQEMLPKLQTGGDWQTALANYTQQMRQQLDQFSTGMLQSSQDTAELWKLYISQMQKFNQLWAASLGAAITPLSQTPAGTPAPWVELNNLYWNLLYEETYGSLMQSPLLGPTRELNSKLLRAFDAWVQLYRAGLDYQILLSNIQVHSFEELMQELVSRAEKGETVKDWRQFQDIWGQVADGVFEKAFCQEDNLRIRGRFLNSLNAYRIHQRGLTEVWLKAVDMPSRSELDEVHQTLYELRKEVKGLKKALAKYESQAEQDATIAPPADSSPSTNDPSPGADSGDSTETPTPKTTRRTRRTGD